MTTCPTCGAPCKNANGVKQHVRQSHGGRRTLPNGNRNWGRSFSLTPSVRKAEWEEYKRRVQQAAESKQKVVNELGVVKAPFGLKTGEPVGG